MEIPVIDYKWGQRFRRWLRRHEIFIILNRQHDFDAEFDGWCTGGCRLLAEVLLPVLTSRWALWTFELKMLASIDCPAEHVVIKAFSPQGIVRYLDGDGVATEKTLLRRFAEESGHQARIVSYDAALLDEWEIQSPPAKQALLRTKILEAFKDNVL